MNRSTLLVLSAVAALVLVAALWLSAQRMPSADTTAQGGLLLPGLAERIADLDEVRLTGAGNEILATLRRDEAGWTVAEREHWPADFTMLRGWLQDIARARAFEAKTRLPGNYAQLGVDDLTDPGAKGVRIDLVAGSETFSLIVGHNNPNGQGSYVRIPDQEQSWLSDANLVAERTPTGWLDRALLSIPADRVVSVRLERRNGERFAIERDPEDVRTLRLTPLAAGRETSGYTLEGMAGFLDEVRMDDVRRAPPEESEPESVAQYLRDDGFLVRVSLWLDDSVDPKLATAVMPWLAFAAEIDEERARAYLAEELEKDRRALAASTRPPVGADEEDGDAATEAEAVADLDGPPPPDVESRLRAMREDAAALNARVEGWRFKLPPFKMANFRRNHDAFLLPRDSD